MISIQKSGDTINFTFTDSSHYLYGNGTISVPENSLSLTIDESDIVNFKKADSNDIFISATLGEFGKTKAELIQFYKDNMVNAGISSGDVETMISSATSGFADSVSYNSTTKYVEFFNGSTKVFEYDASDFVIDGMVDNVEIKTISSGGTNVDVLAITFNVESGKNEIDIPLSDIFDPDLYYTKTEVDSKLSGKVDTSAFTSYSGSIETRLSEKVDTSAFTSYSGSIESRLSEDEEVTSAALNALNETVEGKVDASAITSAVTSGSTDAEIPTAKAVYDAIPQGGGVNVVQTTGTSTADVMSQDAVTTQLNNKANKTAAVGGYKFGSDSSGNYLQYTNVQGSNIGNSIYYPRINGKGIITSNGIYAQNNYNFQLVETSAITTSVTSSSTDAEIPTAKAVYDAIPTGGSVSYSAGTNIDITNDTISCTLPLRVGTGYSSLKLNSDSNDADADYGIVGGILNSINSGASFSFTCGQYNVLKGSHSAAFGGWNTLNKVYNFAAGLQNVLNNTYETAFGYHHLSPSGSTTFGDSGNTLFSVGNGGDNSNDYHNAFEIRQNGDIYVPNTDDTSAVNYYTKPMVRLQDYIQHKIVQMSQSEYDALVNKDANTIYLIIN